MTSLNISLGMVARLRYERIRTRDWTPGSGKKLFYYSKSVQTSCMSHSESSSMLSSQWHDCDTSTLYSA